MGADVVFWHRLQFAFTITYHYLFPQLTMGLALLIVIVKSLALRAPRRAVERRRPVLDPHLRHQLRGGRRDGHADGVPVRHELGARSPALPDGSSGTRSRWKGCSRSSSSRASSALLVFGEKRRRPRGASSRGRGALRRQLALGLLHHRDERVHAASGRTRGARRRHVSSGRFRDLPVQSVGARGTTRTT